MALSTLNEPAQDRARARQHHPLRRRRQLRAGCSTPAPHLAGLLAAAPEVRELLVTSREPLRLAGEHQLALNPLAASRPWPCSSRPGAPRRRFALTLRRAADGRRDLRPPGRPAARDRARPPRGSACSRRGAAGPARAAPRAAGRRPARPARAPADAARRRSTGATTCSTTPERRAVPPPGRVRGRLHAPRPQLVWASTRWTASPRSSTTACSSPRRPALRMLETIREYALERLAKGNAVRRPPREPTPRLRRTRGSGMRTRTWGSEQPRSNIATTRCSRTELGARSRPATPEPTLTLTIAAARLSGAHRHVAEGPRAGRATLHLDEQPPRAAHAHARRRQHPRHQAGGFAAARVHFEASLALARRTSRPRPDSRHQSPTSRTWRSTPPTTPPRQHATRRRPPIARRAEQPHAR